MKLKKLKTVEVIVLPFQEIDRTRDYSDEQRRHAAESLRKEILRHCDTGGAVVHNHYEFVCSFCGYQWDDTPGEPGCCQKAQDEWDLAGAKIGNMLLCVPKS